VPGQLDRAYEALDPTNSLRASIISPSGAWTRKSYASLLSPEPVTAVLGSSEQGDCKTAAFELLDALSRSGALPMQHADLHVVMGACQSFEQSLMDSLVEGNINPIERAERSMLILASTLQQQPAAALVGPAQLERLAGLSPALFPEQQRRLQ